MQSFEIICSPKAPAELEKLHKRLFFVVKELIWFGKPQQKEANIQDWSPLKLIDTLISSIKGFQKQISDFNKADEEFEKKTKKQADTIQKFEEKLAELDEEINYKHFEIIILKEISKRNEKEIQADHQKQLDDLESQYEKLKEQLKKKDGEIVRLTKNFEKQAKDLKSRGKLQKLLGENEKTEKDAEDWMINFPGKSESDYKNRLLTSLSQLLHPKLADDYSCRQEVYDLPSVCNRAACETQ